VSATRRERGKSDFKWLRGHDEVWVLSFRRPAPGWRIFGRFARKNFFVGLRYYEREELADNVLYQQAARDMIADWNRRFPGVEPYRGRDFEDYLGDMVRDDDE